MRTISDIDVGPDWSYVINYADTGTTSWDVGYEASGGNWKVAGSSSFSNSTGRGFDAEYGPYPGRFREAYQIELVHAKVLWQCGSHTSPGPFFVRTVEPEKWTGGTYNQSVRPGRSLQPEVPQAGGRTDLWLAGRGEVLEVLGCGVHLRLQQAGGGGLHELDQAGMEEPPGATSGRVWRIGKSLHREDACRSHGRVTAAGWPGFSPLRSQAWR